MGHLDITRISYVPAPEPSERKRLCSGSCDQTLQEDPGHDSEIPPRGSEPAPQRPLQSGEGTRVVECERHGPQYHDRHGGQPG